MPGDTDVWLAKSTDGGKSWQHLGLEERHHISRIILHPTDPNTAWVAVLGHLYSPNKERGVYKTNDGGKTWKLVLFANENSGAADLVIDPQNPNVLYAATWHRERRAWNFVESGTGTGLYKSTDGGNKWTLLSTTTAGFPTGEGAGRIGLSLSRSGGKTVLYAAIDNYNRRPSETPEVPDALTNNVPLAVTNLAGGREDYFSFDVSARAISVSFEVTGATQDVDLYVSPSPDLPRPMQSTYSSRNFGLQD